MPKRNRQKLTRLELEIMEPLWRLGEASIRMIREELPAKRRPEYTTVQTIVYRLEGKGAVKRIRKIGNAHVFVPAISRKSAVGKLVDDLLSLLGSPAPLMSHLVETRQITLEELKEMEDQLAARNEGRDPNE